MFKRVENDDKYYIKEYIGKDYDKCLYLYLDLMKYGLNNENIKFWFDKKNNEIICVILKYYSGMHVFSKKHDCDYEEIAKLIIEENPSIICAEKFLIKNLSEYLRDFQYNEEYGWVRVLSKNINCENSSVVRANEEDLKQISNLIINDPIGVFYDFDDFVSQIKERENDNYARSYVIKENDKVISNASTSAECDEIAVLSNVITDKDYRCRGLATKVCSKLCNDLIGEGKRIFLINYSDESTALYDKLGFEISCEIGKLYLKK